MNTENQKWEPIEVPENLKKPLIRQILKGRIIREQFKELWPEDVLLIKVIWPKDEND